MTPPPQGWIEFGEKGDPARVMRLPKSESGVCVLSPDHALITGDAGWSNYVMEATVMLRTNQGSAGFILRANPPGPGGAPMRGYAVGFDANTVTLAKMDNGGKPLASFDLAKLECKAGPGAWNHLRVAVDGKRIRVWFNRMHPSADPANGLRIDFVDKDDPVLSGQVGLRAVGGEAWFDNVVVLSLSLLPEKTGKAGR